jgi:hypothetical protein
MYQAVLLPGFSDSAVPCPAARMRSSRCCASAATWSDPWRGEIGGRTPSNVEEPDRPRSMVSRAFERSVGASVMSSDPSAEQQVLLGALNRQREHVLAAVDGLGTNDLRRHVLPSGWTCIGLVILLGRSGSSTFDGVRPPISPRHGSDHDACRAGTASRRSHLCSWAMARRSQRSRAEGRLGTCSGTVQATDDLAVRAPPKNG